MHMHYGNNRLNVKLCSKLRMSNISSTLSVTGNGVVRQQASGFKLCNGLDWTVDTRTMVLADSLQKAIFAFDFDVETGQISKFKLQL